jgi:CHAT domain-containing protein
MKKQVESTRNRLLELQTDLSEFQNEMARKYPVSEGQSFSLAQIQKSIPKRAAIIGWIDVEVRENEYRSWGYVIRATGDVTWARVAVAADGKGSPFDRTAAFRDALVSPEGALAGFTRDAKTLWTERIEPLRAALQGVEHLIVIPSGAMLGIPVETLIDDESKTIADRYIVSYTPSATVYCWLKEQQEHKAKREPVLLVGDPPFRNEHHSAMAEDGGAPSTDDSTVNGTAGEFRFTVVRDHSALAALPRLEGTRAEVTSIAAVAKSPTVMLGEDASEKELVRMVENGTIGEFGSIHIATHALIDDRRPELSALVLSQVGLPDPLESAMKKERIIDGLVTAREIIREWNLSADIVTLSACETGLGMKAGGEGYIGFSHAFFQAGAKSLLVSLWKVEDNATSLLMKKFYELYFDDKTATKAGALKEAKNWLRSQTDENGGRPYEHPFYWSGFVLIGDDGRSN